MRVRLDAPSDGPVTLRLGELDVSNITSDVCVRALAGGRVSAEVSIWARDNLSLDVDADVTLALVALPGYRTIEERLPNGGKRIRVVPEEQEG